MMLRALLAVVVVATSVVTAPAAPAAADTTVKPDGKLVTITLKVDVFAGKNVRTGSDGTPIDQYFKGIMETTWGAAFGKLPYKSCFFFELVLDFKLYDINDKGRNGSHKLYVGTETRGWKGVGWDHAPKETSRNGTGDGTRSFENDRKGDIPANAPPTVVAHEFGHLFGLGDDRKDGAPKNGRDGTMMVGGVPGVDVNVVQRIDQNLIDRIGEAIEKHLENQGKKLPKCETWKGPVRSTVVGSGDVCTGGENGTITLAVVGDSVSGTLDASGSLTCTVDGFTDTVATFVGLRLTGSLEDGEFRLEVSERSGSFETAVGCWAGFGSFDIPVERRTGSAEFTFPGADHVYTCDITIERQPDDEAVG